MALPFILPPPAPLDIHDTKVADNWKKFTRAWTKLLTGKGAKQKSELNQVKTLLTVIGEDACEGFCTFND